MSIAFLQQGCDGLDAELKTEEVNAEAKKLYMVAMDQAKERDYKNALVTYKKSMDLYEIMEDHEHIAGILTNVGVMFRHCGEYDKAIEFYHRALKIIETKQIDNPTTKAKVLYNLARSFRYKKELDSAFVYYNVADRLFESLNNKVYQAKIANQLGICYYELEDYDEALRYYTLSYNRNPSEARKANYYNNIGNVQLERGQVEEALVSFTSALGFYEKTGASNSKLSLCLRNIARCHKQNESLKTTFLEKALALEKDKELRQNILLDLAILYKNKKNSDALYASLSEVATLSKSIKERKQVFDKKYQSMQLEFAIAEIKNIELHQAREKEKEQNIIAGSISGSIALLLIFILGWRMRKRDMRLRAFKKELIGDLEGMKM